MGIVAQKLCKLFAEAEAVRELSLEVRPGEIYGLMGPNGAGKTTALRMLAGLMQPSGGSATVCGHDVVSQSDRAKAHLGFLTGSTGLYSRLTVTELLTYFGKLCGYPGHRLPGRIQQLLDDLHVSHLAGRLCGKLSTGEKQRVSLARATIHDPEVLILDEPTAGLDVLASRFVADFIRGCRDRDRAVLFSTHYMTEAELLCDRVGLLFGGRLIWEGTPAALRRQQDASSLEEAFLKLIEANPPPGSDSDHDIDPLADPGPVEGTP